MFVIVHLGQKRMIPPQDRHQKGLESESCSVLSDSLQPRGPHSPWNSPGQNTGVGGLSLLQGTFSTQGSNAGLSTLWVDSLSSESLGRVAIEKSVKLEVTW